MRRKRIDAHVGERGHLHHLARVLQSRSSVDELAGLVFESKTPVSRQLRQEIGTYVSLAVHRPSSVDTRQGANMAEADCASIQAPVAPGCG
jgi:hypothetical protein